MACKQFQQTHDQRSGKPKQGRRKRRAHAAQLRFQPRHKVREDINPGLVFLWRERADGLDHGRNSCARPRKNFPTDQGKSTELNDISALMFSATRRAVVVDRVEDGLRLSRSRSEPPCRAPRSNARSSPLPAQSGRCLSPLSGALLPQDDENLRSRRIRAVKLDHPAQNVAQHANH